MDALATARDGAADFADFADVADVADFAAWVSTRLRMSSERRWALGRSNTAVCGRACERRSAGVKRREGYDGVKEGAQG